MLVSSAVGPLDPRLLRDSTTAKVSRLVYRGLYRVRGRDLAAEPDLAKEIVEEGELRRCVVLRRDVSFHDGRPLRAGDVAHTILSAMEPRNRSPIGGLYRDRFTQVLLPDGEDGDRVCFVLRSPVATFMTDLVIGIVPRGTPVDPTRDPVGAGPYRVHRRDGDRGVVLERTTPSREHPRFTVFRTLPDENTRLLSLLAGDADLVYNDFSPAVVSLLEEAPEVQVLRHPSIAVTYLTLNTTRAPLHDARVRRAVAHALDRAWIAGTRFGGAARVAASMLPEGHWAHAEGLYPPPYDPEVARELLDRAGLRPDAGGTRARLELLASNDRQRRLVARDIARFLGAVGIDVRVRSLELGTFLEHVRGGRYEMAVLQLPEPIEPDMLRWMFHSLSTPLGSVDDAVTARGRAPRNHLEPGLLGLLASDLASTTCRAWAASRLTRGAVDTLSFLALGRPPRSGGGNRSFWSDTELDCWLDRARRVEQPSERKALYELVQRRLLRDLPVVFLWHEDNVVVLARGLEGAELSLRPDPAFLPRLVRLP